jgi:hypothetical protein
MVVAFGTMFNNIRLVRYNKAGTTEIERITVPLTYAPKEKFYARLQQDPNMNQAVQITLPRMSFELASITYDPVRKTSMFNRTFSPLNDTQIRSVRMAPYNFDFTLNVYVRNTEDGTQIIEQILPYFTPDYTLTGDVVGLSEPIDLPIILQNVTYDPDFVGGPDDLRVLTWTLNFTMKGYMYGPISNVSVIRSATANTFNDTFNLDSARKLTVNSATGSGGAGTFKIGELVFQGDSFDVATSTAYVDSWSPSTNTLILVDSSGVLESGKFITGAVSNASYNVVSFGTNDQQLVNITITPDPNTANVNTAFGFDTTIEEFPDIV